jgi:hypothetical protein
LRVVRCASQWASPNHQLLTARLLRDQWSTDKLDRCIEL